MAKIEFSDRPNYVTMANSDVRDGKKDLAMAKVEFGNLINHLTLTPLYRSYCLRVSNLAEVGKESTKN